MHIKFKGNLLSTVWVHLLFSLRLLTQPNQQINIIIYDNFYKTATNIVCWEYTYLNISNAVQTVMF